MTTAEGPRRGRMDPRIRARRVAVTRQHGRRRLWAALSAVALVALGAGTWFLLHSAVFSARVVTVIGATHETAAQVEAAGGLSVHPPLLDVSTAAVAEKIEALPWVQTARVTLHWPDGVRIAITERTPRLTAPEAGGQWAELSADGRVLATVPARPAGLMLFDAPAPVGPPGSALGASADAGLDVAATLPASFAAQVTEVKVEPGGWVQLALTTPVVVDIGSASQLHAKYEDVTAILAGAPLTVGDVIDVSVPKAPTVTGA